jgi:DNA-binding MurR/RpiR family transcriptional regulator
MPVDEPAPTEARTLAERIRAELPRLTPAERRVARALLADYPLAGLEPVAALAHRADTSAPTVLRLVNKLDLDGYASFQQVIKAELAVRLSSPLTLYPTEPAGAEVLPRMRESLTESVRRGLQQLEGSGVDTAVGLMSDHRRPLWTIGGRFSRMLADYLALHLQLLRPAVAKVPAEAGDRTITLLDIDRRSVLVAFDYRRYQRSTIDFGVAAARRGATVVLFTDHHLSPLAADAAVVLPTTVQAPTPFDVLTPALAVVEAMVAGVVDRLGAAPRARLAAFDALNTDILDRAGQRPIRAEGLDMSGGGTG